MHTEQHLICAVGPGADNPQEPGLPAAQREERAHALKKLGKVFQASVSGWEASFWDWLGVECAAHVLLR